MLEDSVEGSERKEALGDLRRLTNIILDNLERGSQERLMEAREIRLLGSTAIRSIRLWLTALEHPRRKDLERTSGYSGDKVGSTGQEV